MPERDDRLTTDDLATSPGREDAASEHRDERGIADRMRDSARGLTEAVRDEPEARADEPAQGQRAATDTGRSADRGEEARDEPMLPPSDLRDYRGRWESVQTQFVDEPRRAVEDADTLVAEVMRKLADTFASERATLEQQWDRGGQADTEALRVTLQRYRSFFNRLLSM